MSESSLKGAQLRKRRHKEASVAREIFEQLKARGINVGYFDDRRVDGGLRITIGTDGEIDALFGALGEVVRR